MFCEITKRGGGVGANEYEMVGGGDERLDWT